MRKDSDCTCGSTACSSKNFTQNISKVGIVIFVMAEVHVNFSIIHIHSVYQIWLMDLS